MKTKELNAFNHSNNRTNVEVTINLIVTNEDIDDIMTTAMEGGINYWCDEVRVIGDSLGEYASDQISRGGDLVVDTQDGEYSLSKEKLLKGIQMYVTRSHPCNIIEDSKDGFRVDTCEVDAEVADMIVQYALFGDIVYG